MLSEAFKVVIRCILVVVLLLAVVGLSPLPVRSQEFLDLVLGGEGSTSWNIDNVVPGDSGTKTVTLYNDSDIDGFVTIWISDIISSEGVNPESETGDIAEPGELGNYLLFSGSCSRLDTNLNLPATIYDLPQSASDPNYIVINPLYAHETITLVWEWEFHENGQPQNDAQGDKLSFTINYIIGEPPPAPSGGGSSEIEDNRGRLRIGISGKVTVAWVTAEGRLLDPLVAADADNKFKLEFKRSTKVTSADDKAITGIEIKLCEQPRSPPEGMEIIGPAYDFTGYIGSTAVPSISFDPPIILTLSYDPDWLPENASSLFIAWYNGEQSWQYLEMGDSAAEPGEITALISHASTFAILVEVEPDKLAPVEPAPDQPAPVEPAPVEPAPARQESSSPPPPSSSGEDIITQNQDVPDQQPVVSSTTDYKEALRQASLAIAATGIAAMATLAYIQRRRRNQR